MDSSIISPEDPTQRVPFPDPVAAAPMAPTSATHCANCGAFLAADQRYCVECGERHGDPRLPVMSGRQDLTASALAPQPPRKGSRLARASANTALIAGVGTLLVALGVGVLIGRTSDNPNQPAASAAPQVVTIAGGGAVAGATGASSAAPASTADASTSGAAKDAKGKAAAAGDKGKSTDKSDAASAPASGKAVPKKAGKVVTVGSKGSGKGYKNGKFTGDFFGQ